MSKFININMNVGNTKMIYIVKRSEFSGITTTTVRTIRGRWALIRRIRTKREKTSRGRKRQDACRVPASNLVPERS